MEPVVLCSGCNQRFRPDQVKKCGVCLLTLYCSKECQTGHWTLHRQSCSSAASRGHLGVSRTSIGEANGAVLTELDGARQRLRDARVNERIRKRCAAKLDGIEQWMLVWGATGTTTVSSEVFVSSELVVKFCREMAEVHRMMRHKKGINHFESVVLGLLQAYDAARLVMHPDPGVSLTVLHGGASS